MTLAELEALEERRAIEIRHARFNAALIATAVYNAKGGELSPFDFLPGYERDPEEETRKKIRRDIKRGIAERFIGMQGATRAECLAEKAKMVERMLENGVTDPEGLIREVFPEL